MGEKRVTISLPESLYREAERWAKAWGCTTEEFIITSIEKLIEEERAKCSIKNS
ncbi:MAG: hypothetical protein QW636_07455 [Candidatus Bathyarchaeia archaeon]